MDFKWLYGSIISFVAEQVLALTSDKSNPNLFPIGDRFGLFAFLTLATVLPK